MKTVIGFLLIFLLGKIAYTDYRTHTIPDRYVLLTVLLGMIAFVCGVPQIPLLSRLLGILAAGVPLLLLSILSPGAFGGGDIKFMAAAGFLLGAENGFRALILAFVIGGIYALVMVVIGRLSAGQRFAFGPFLCAGILLVMLYELLF